MTLLWVFMCLPHNLNKMLLIQCVMSYCTVNQKWESSMQRSQLDADRRLTLPSQLGSEALSLLLEFLCHVGWTCLCHSVLSLLLTLKTVLRQKIWTEEGKDKGKPKEHVLWPFFNEASTVKANDASSRKGSHWGFHSERHVNMCYVYIQESLGQLSVLTVKYVFYLLFWSSLRIAFPWILIHRRAVVTSSWIWWSNCGNSSFGMCLYSEKQNLKLK